MVYGVIISLAALAAVWKVCNTCVEVQRTKHSVTYPVDPVENDVEAEHMLAWSISSALAAISPSELEYLSEPLAGLVRQAQALHPQMALGAHRREEHVALH